jgi:hypothetical protein
MKKEDKKKKEVTREGRRKEKSQRKKQVNKKGRKGKVLPVRAMKAYSGSAGIAPLILNLSTRWR